MQRLPSWLWGLLAALGAYDLGMNLQGNGWAAGCSVALWGVVLASVGGLGLGRSEPLGSALQRVLWAVCPALLFAPVAWTLHLDGSPLSLEVEAPLARLWAQVTALHAGLAVGALVAALYSRAAGLHRWAAAAVAALVCGGGAVAALLPQSLPSNWAARTELRRALQLVRSVQLPLPASAGAGATGKPAAPSGSLNGNLLRAEGGVMHALQALHVAGMRDAAWVWVAQAAAQGAPVELLRLHCPAQRVGLAGQLRPTPLTAPWGKQLRVGRQVCAAIAPLLDAQQGIPTAAAAISDVRLRLHVAGEQLFEGGEVQAALAQFLQAVPLDATQRQYALWQLTRRGRVQEAQALRTADAAAWAGQLQPVGAETAAWAERLQSMGAEAAAGAGQQQPINADPRATAAAYGAQLNFIDLMDPAQRGVLACPPRLRSRFDTDLQRAVVETDLPHGGAVRITLPLIPPSLTQLRLLIRARSQTTVAAMSPQFGSVRREIMPGPWQVVDIALPGPPAGGGSLENPAEISRRPDSEEEAPITVQLLGDFALAAVGAPVNREPAR